VTKAFLDYVARIRRIPPRAFIVYTSFNDLHGWKETSGPGILNEQNTLERVSELQENFVSKFGVHIDSFELDAVWEDPNRLWEVDLARFPSGFRSLARELKETLDSHLGLWLSPIGGYAGSVIP